jgi:hypothetical protein
MTTAPDGGPIPAEICNLTPEELAALLPQLQQALFALITGRREVTVSYAQGDGAKSVTYNSNAANVSYLRYLIQYIGVALGTSCGRRRRAIGVAFP